MDQSVVALVGVVVGALLGGIAQAVSAVIQDAMRHRAWKRESRHDVHMEFMAAWARLTFVWDMQPSKDPVVRDAATNLVSRLQQVRLSATREAADAAGDFYQVIIDVGRSGSAADIKKRNDALEAYVQAAQREATYTRRPEKRRR